MTNAVVSTHCTTKLLVICLGQRNILKNNKRKKRADQILFILIYLSVNDFVLNHKKYKIQV